MEIKHRIKPELFSICKEILIDSLELKNWRLIESCDQFQTKYYSGGFDATEDEFTFSYYDPNGDEYWFQLSLSDIDSIVKGKMTEINIRKAD